MTATYVPQRDQALFRLDGDRLVPGPLTKGPWYEGTLHGSAMLAAVARSADRHPSEVPRQVVRLTVDMVRAASMGPLKVESSTVRAGRSTDLVEVVLHDDQGPCVRATALRMRLAELAIAGVTDGWGPGSHPEPPAGAPDAAGIFAHPGAEEPAFHHAIDVHLDVDRATMWFRLAVPVVEGEETASSVAVAAVADWTYATPQLLQVAAGHMPPEDEVMFAINADTTINTFRPRSGEWIGLRSVAHFGSHGAGTSRGDLFDERGPLGSCTQSILVRGPEGAPLWVKEARPT